MKSETEKQRAYHPRIYRDLALGKRMVSFRVAVKETDLFIHAESPLENHAKNLIIEHRGYLENYIDQHPEYAASLTPVSVTGPAPKIVRDMAEAGASAGVGPMAAVAGAIAEQVGQGLLARTPEAIVENGGDIFMKLTGPFTVGIYAGDSPLSMRVGLRLDTGGEPVSVCTSSGTVGHSLSLGKADAVCVVSNACALADAAATAIGNHLKTPDDISAAVEFGQSIDGVQGIVAVMGEKMGMWGNLDVIPITEKRG